MGNSFFLIIASSAINSGFAKFEHPGGQTSLTLFPSILTDDPEAKTIMAISIIGILVWCVGGLTTIILLLYKLPSMQRNAFFLKSTGSITLRFGSKVPWWFLVQMFLNLLIAMTMSLFQSGGWQMVWMIMVFSFYLVGLLSFKPWFCPMLHYADLCATFGKILILVSLLPYHYTKHESEPSGATFAVIISTIVYIVCSGQALYALFRSILFASGQSTQPITEIHDDLGGSAAKALRLPESPDLVTALLGKEQGESEEQVKREWQEGEVRDV